MEKLDFWTPIWHEGKSAIEYLQETVDGYFYFGDKHAHILHTSNAKGSVEVTIDYVRQSKREKALYSAIKIATFITGVIPLIMIIGKLIFRALHHFHTEPFKLDPPSSDPDQAALEEGININAATVEQIKKCMDDIFVKQQTDSLKIYGSNHRNRVFSLKNNPDIVFKWYPDREDLLQARYTKMIRAKKICKEHKLDLLEVPNAKKFTFKSRGRKYTMIAERKMNILPNEAVQEELYAKQADKLNEAIKQLTTFICKTGFSDVEWRNIPVLHNTYDENGNLKIALIDLEEMDSVDTGLLGNAGLYSRRGLIGCVAEEQVKIILEEARKHEEWTKDMERGVPEAIERRHLVLEKNRQLDDFYDQHGIKQGHEPLVIDAKRVEFTKAEKPSVDIVVKEINRQLAASAPEYPRKERRNVCLNRGEMPIRTVEEKDPTAFERIISKLLDAGYLYKRVRDYDPKEWIQA